MIGLRKWGRWIIVSISLLALVVLSFCVFPYTTQIEKGDKDIVAVKVSDASVSVDGKRQQQTYTDWEKEWEENLAKSRARSEERRKQLEKIMAESAQKEQKRPRRSLRRFRWESPAETRSKLWNVPEEESDEAVATAFMRVCISESDGYQPDCLGIWQVVRSIRSRKCDRARIRRITECDNSGETLLSVLRRASKYVLGVVPPRSRRQAWISNLELSCEMPKSWPYSERKWKRQYQNKRCPETAKLARDLIAGKRDYDWPISGARPVTWGGRCESGKGACDDDIACSRGLARLYTDTLNAFWCLPGTRGCSTDIDPICIKRGFPSVKGKNLLAEEELEPQT